jgi:hypothetical protein
MQIDPVDRSLVGHNGFSVEHFSLNTIYNIDQRFQPSTLEQASAETDDANSYTENTVLCPKDRTNAA